MTAALTLAIDRSSGGFQPAELRLRVRGPDGEVLTQDPVVTGIELSPPDLVTATPITDPTPGVLAYRCEVDLEVLGRDAELVKGGTRAVTMTIRALPGDGHEQPLIATCPIEVVVPSPTIRWYAHGDPTTIDRPVRVDATAGSEFALHVRLERFSPADGRLTTVDDAMFSHMVNIGPAGQTPFTYTVFGVHPDARPWDAPAGSRCEVSRWRLATDLPPEGRPELTAPSSTFIRVRAWGAGVITGRHPDRIDASEPHLAECFVPVEFAPVEVIAELLEPPMPIPADGRRVELVVALRRSGSDQAAAGVPVALSLRHHADADGNLDPAAATATSDDDGLIRLEYTTPALAYRAGGRYLEELIVARRGEGATDEIAAFALHLNPELRAELNVAKDGLEFDTVHIHRPAGRTPATVTGNVWLKVENRLVRGEQTSPVEHAQVSLLPETAAPGSSSTPSASSEHTCRSGELGAIGFTLAELREGWAAADEQRRREVETPLDADREIPAGRFDADVTLVIDRYDDRVGPQTWLGRCGALTDRRMATQRLTLGDQLARRPETDLPRAISGTLLLERATHIPPLVDRRYRMYWPRVAEHLGGFFDELVSLAMTITQIASKVADAATKLASAAITATTRVLGRALSGLGSMLGGVFGVVAGMLEGLLAGVGRAFPALRTTIIGLEQTARELLTTISDGAGRTGAGQAIIAFGQKLLNLVARFFGKLARALLDGARWVLELAMSGAKALAEQFAYALRWTGVMSRKALAAAARQFGVAMTSEVGVESIAYFVGEDLKARLDRISTFIWSGPSSADGQQSATDLGGGGASWGPSRGGPIGAGLSGRIATYLRDQLDHTYEATGSALDVLCECVDQLWVPEDPHEARRRAQDRATSIQYAEATHATIFDSFAAPLQVLDTLYTCVKVVAVAVAGATGMILGVAITPLIAALDLAWAKLKAFKIHLPAAISAAVLAVGSIVAGHLIIGDLASTSGTTP